MSWFRAASPSHFANPFFCGNASNCPDFIHLCPRRSTRRRNVPLPVCHLHFHQLHLPCCPFPHGPDRFPWGGTTSNTALVGQDCPCWPPQTTFDLLHFATSISISSTCPAAHSHRNQTGFQGGTMSNMSLVGQDCPCWPLQTHLWPPPVCHFHFYQLHLPCCPFPQGSDRYPWGEPCPTHPCGTGLPMLATTNPPLASSTPNPYPGFGQNDTGASPGEREQIPLSPAAPWCPTAACCRSQDSWIPDDEEECPPQQGEVRNSIPADGEGWQQSPAPSSPRPQQRPNNFHGVKQRFLMGFCRAGRQMEQPGRALRNAFQPAEPECNARTCNITNWLAAMHQMQKHFSLSVTSCICSNHYNFS